MTASRLMWFGLLGAPLALVAFLTTGFVMTQVQCDAGSAGSTAHFDAWTIALTGVAVAIAAASVICALLAWRMTREAGDEPPAARIHFMSVMALTVAPLTLVIMLMAGIGSAALDLCVQS